MNLSVLSFFSMCSYSKRVDLFIDKVADLCREYNLCLVSTDPYEGIDVVPFSEEDLDILLSNKTSDLPF